MRKALLALVVVTVVPALVIGACKKKEEEPPPSSGYQPGYGQPQPGYGQPQPGYGQPTAQPTMTATLSQPGPMAPPCQSDANCLTHRCNTQFGKCVVPCQTPNDCNPGNNCMMGGCFPAVAPGGTAPGGPAPAPAPTQ